MPSSAKPQEFGYTLVQHSGFGYAEKPGFEKGLEIRTLNRLSERNLVQRVGGVIYENYHDARDAEEELMYPEGYGGIYPSFQGAFSDKMIDGLRIAIIQKVQAVPEGLPF